MDSGKLTNEVKKWAGDRVADMKSEAAKLNIFHRNDDSTPSSIDGITRRVSMRMGVPFKISFKFARHLIFVHKGVGRGTPAASAGSGARKPKPWFEPVIERNIDELGDIVAEGLGDDVIRNFKL